MEIIVWSSGPRGRSGWSHRRKSIHPPPGGELLQPGSTCILAEVRRHGEFGINDSSQSHELPVINDKLCCKGINYLEDSQWEEPGRKKKQKGTRSLSPKSPSLPIDSNSTSGGIKMGGMEMKDGALRVD